ncbi:sensor histidine kinase [Catenuloplanes japonicus]|uniref:sensor histidine kinase n=1 Tax=Catenuloplanes japonicus TaxID=33876 RepID=UPI000524D1C0|nr:histidine kinase [Catenuloplanes japonicus]
MGRWLDAGLGLATAGVVAAAVTVNLRGDGAPPVAYLFAAGFGALMLVRRPYPVLALVATGIGLLGYYALGLPPIGLALPVGAALYSAAEAGRLRWAAGTATALVAISSVARTLGGEDPGYLYVYELPTTVALMAAAIVLGDGVRARALWRREVEARHAREAERRVQHERLALARDLHDVLAHTVSIVTLHADVAAEALADNDVPEAQKAISRVRDASTGAARELRATLSAMRTPLGTLSRLHELIGGTDTGTGVDVRIEGEVRPLPQVVDATAYRIAQEALTNARRHASGAPVSLTLSFRTDELVVTIVNAWSGTKPDKGGHGLHGMRERAALLGGTLTAGPTDDGTFVVTATLPTEAGA